MPAGLPAPTGLPVEEAVDDVRRALATSGAAVLVAQPGAGKTTVVPLRLLDEPWLDGGRIVVLEPRRLAVRAAARRAAHLLGEKVGSTVGYRTRDERVGDDPRLEFVTEGILTRRLQRDPSLEGVGLVVFDEVHERNLHTDVALALAVDARNVLRPDLRLLAMSATLDAVGVAAALGGDDGHARVVTGEGRTYPVEVRWRPPGPRDRPAESMAGAVRHALAHHDGDVLAFLAGAADIDRTHRLLATHRPDDVDVRRLYGALPPAEQDAALAPSPPGRRRVVLATDIAETSLTPEGITVVVDSGLVRRPRLDARSGLSRLHTGPTSRASADQRAGRAGRLGPGVVYRLWSEADHRTRAQFAPPEMLAADLAGLALELAAWGTHEDALAFLDPPPAATLAEARRLLRALGALDDEGAVTPMGRTMIELPLHPRLAHMLVVADATGDGRLAADVAAVVDERDILRGRPEELSADIGDRLRALAAADRGHPVRRRADEFRRRLRRGGRRGRSDGGHPDRVGRVLALAYPDRVAMATGDGRYRLRNGLDGWLGDGDPLRAERFLVVASLGGDGRITLAAPLDPPDVDELFADDIEERRSLVWDSSADDLRQRQERRLGALVLGERSTRPEPGPETAAALVAHARATDLRVLRWTPAARTFQARVGFVRRSGGFGPGVDSDQWPDLSDPALAATAEEWLTPRLGGATGRAALERLDLRNVLADLVGHHRLHDLDRLTPPTFTLPSGRRVSIDYTGEQPTVAVRVQELFGTTTHPAVADGRLPLVLELLSPAGRPVQVTADLPGFWAGSWEQVRKDMAGRYPKHPWPTDPASATPPSVSRRSGR
ncbi:MAG: ATP-dependent helicase HrpB [Acidimicrobiia bacterium]|nr:ATP-dependent helicase HrpB [Acidimicrobiia bacterium]